MSGVQTATIPAPVEFMVINCSNALYAEPDGAVVPASLPAAKWCRCPQALEGILARQCWRAPLESPIERSRSPLPTCCSIIERTMEIHLIRHTRPGLPEGTCYGRTDVPLDEAEFSARVARIADHLPADMVFYSSPASRCARLAERLVADTGGSLAGVDGRIHELDFGDWEGRLWSDLPSHETDRWRSDIVHYAPPNGEGFMAMWDRVSAFYQAILDAAFAGSQARIGIVGLPAFCCRARSRPMYGGHCS